MNSTASRVSLRPITADTVRSIVALGVTEYQNRFVAPNGLSLAQALFAPEAWYRAIYLDDEPVGFVMLADESLLSPPPPGPEVGVWRFMIDARHQRQGIGRAALRLVIEHIRSKGFHKLALSYVAGEGSPEPLYRSFGFRPTGEVDDGEIVMELAIDATTPNTLTITLAAPHEAAAIHAIQMRAFAEEGRLSGTTDLPPLQETVEAIEQAIRTHTVLTARDGGRIVGSARGIVEGSVCTIRGVSVDPSEQGRGIGGALLDAVEQRHASVERFDLTTNSLVPGSVAFYERRGYVVREVTRFGERVLLAQMSKPSQSAMPVGPGAAAGSAFTQPVCT